MFLMKYSLFLFTFLLPLPALADFSDVPDTHPNAEAITWAAEEEIVQGFDDGAFRPEQPVTRAELIKIVMTPEMYSACEEENALIDRAVVFPDLSNHWAEMYVWCSKINGVVKGYDDGLFRPNNPVTFTEAAKIITLALGEEIKADEELWYKNYVQFLSNKQAIPTSILELDKKLTRGEVVEMMWRVKEEKRVGRIVKYFVRRENGKLQSELRIMLNSMYSQNKNGIYFNFSQNPIEEIDPETFTALQKNPYIGKDKNYVYIDGARNLDLDPVTTKSFGSVYFGDNNSVFYVVRVGSGQVHGADPTSFEDIGAWKGKDKNNVYALGDIVPNADPETFQLIPAFYHEVYGYGSCGFSVDKNSFYVGRSVIEGISPAAKNEMKIFVKGSNKFMSILELSEEVPFLSEYCGTTVIEIKDELYCDGISGKPKKLSISAEEYEKNYDKYHYAGFYFQKDKESYYVEIFDPEFNGECREKIVALEVDTLVTFPKSLYAKDSTSVFYAGQKIENADPATFQIIENSDEYDAEDKNAWYKDGEVAKEKVYCGNEYVEKYGKIYYYDFEIEDIDIENFEVGSTNNGGGEECWYIKDEDTVYIGIKKMTDADASSFKASSWKYFLDKNFVYDSRGEKIFVTQEEQKNGEGITLDTSYALIPEGFKPRHPSQYLVNDTGVYCIGHGYIRKIDANRENVKWITGVYGDGYRKDNQHVYYNCDRVLGADSSTFTVDIPGADWIYGRDSTSVYYMSQKLEGADPNTIEVIQYGPYAKDKNAIFYNAQKIENADTETFTIIENSDEYDAQDKNHKYLRGEIVE